MSNTINGRTPEEIKRMLQCLSTPCAGECEECEHNVGEPDFTPYDAYVCALALIQDLEAERDAAVEDINEAAMTGCLCYVCSRNEKGHCKAFDRGIFEAAVMCGQYEWRGVQEVE